MRVPTSPSRSRLMSRIRGKDTQLEMRLGRELHRRGFRYRLHDNRLPGKPDLVFPGLRAVIFINGCFWHGHACSLYRLPKTNTEFWAQRSEEHTSELQSLMRISYAVFCLKKKKKTTRH